MSVPANQPPPSGVSHAETAWWKRPIVLACSSALITLVIVEIGFQASETDAIRAFFTPFEHSDATFAEVEIDEKTGRTLTWYIPNATGTTGVQPVKINNLGFRDERDYPETKPAGCLRVLALGDSMTFGKGVREQDTFLAVAEDRLQKRFPKRCIEIINAAQPNTNFFQHYLQYRLRWFKLQPDVVLFCFFPYNDTQVEDDEEPFSQGWMEFIDRNDWLKMSATIRWLYHRLFFDLGNSSLQDGMQRFFAADYPGWVQFAESVPDLARYAEGKNSEVSFLLVPVPAGYERYPYLAQHQQIRQVTEQNGISTFDLLSALKNKDVIASDHWVHPSDAHPDVALHRIYGEWVAKALPWQMWIQRAR